MTDHYLRDSPNAASRRSISRAWLAIPIAVLLGLATRHVSASFVGGSAGDYLGFAVALISVTWFLADKARSTWGVNVALSAFAGVVGVLILFILRYLWS